MNPVEKPTAAELRYLAGQARRLAKDRLSEGVFDLGWTNLRIRFSGGAYVARGAGITASCTAGTTNAIAAWATKVEARAAELEAGA